MDLLKYIFHLGVIYTGFDLVWWLFNRLLGMLNQGQALSKNLRQWVLTPLSTYLVVALTVLETNRQVALETDNLSFWLIIGLGTFTLLFYRLSKLKRQTAVRFSLNGRAMAEEPSTNLRFEWALNGLAIIAFAGGLFMPQAAANPLTIWLHQLVLNLNDIPVNGWIIGILSIFFLLRVMFLGFQTIKSSLAWFPPAHPDEKQTHRQAEPDFDDFEVVDEEQRRLEDKSNNQRPD